MERACYVVPDYFNYLLQNIPGKVYLSNKKCEIPTLSSLMQLNSPPKNAADIIVGVR